ncbi:hypothetical protein ASPWEDRAFT_119845 [Aspergillus wentii DTO 134E9]|uniref:DUF1275 domain protein n=1 Tax=Aspergillus wentii DTO 134E9 TaxID=1073089 RepID=A0A1L9R7R6_ASPWE|nr:uncharacterized protein ASPWEDRAFT_119845 [Aspergillus wentii DTO 134E9]OJJ30913.1 hypothetical protein ASPWEDRAFT_119845 [Aspergillus wentii DTO 134E9]
MALKFDDEERQLYTPRPLTGNTEVSTAETCVTEKEQLPARRGFVGYLSSEIDTKWSDIPLIVCCYVGGLIDGLSYNYWGNFSNMQTGNTIFIALGVAGKPDHPDMLWAKSLIAVCAFLLGNIVFIHGGRLLGSTRRISLILSFALQAGLILGTAILVHTVPPMPDNPTSVEWRKVVPILLISFQSAGQLTASRILGFPEIPTVLLTALVCDLLLDAKLYQRPLQANPKRNRRIGALLMHFFGSMTAGGMAKHVGLAGGLFLAAAAKGAITVSWFFWKEKMQVKMFA